jgi:hypothetical protein
VSPTPVVSVTPTISPTPVITTSPITTPNKAYLGSKLDLSCSAPILVPVFTSKVTAYVQKDSDLATIDLSKTDTVLFKRGGTYTLSKQFFVSRGLFGAYGEGAKPIVIAPSGFVRTNTAKNLVIRDLVLKSSPKSLERVNVQNDAIRVGPGSENILIENMEIDSFRTGFIAENANVKNVVLRNNKITNSFSFGANAPHAQGAYIEGVDGVVLDGNLFDHNGWKEGQHRSIFNHNAYVQVNNKCLIAEGNVFKNGSNFGLQARGGGTIRNNKFIGNANHMEFGYCNGGMVELYKVPVGVSGEVTGNMFVGSYDWGRGGIKFGNTLQAKAGNNTFVGESGPLIKAEPVAYDIARQRGIGVHNLKFEGNNFVYNIKPVNRLVVQGKAGGPVYLRAPGDIADKAGNVLISFQYLGGDREGTGIKWTGEPKLINDIYPRGFSEDVKFVELKDKPSL